MKNLFTLNFIRYLLISVLITPVSLHSFSAFAQDSEPVKDDEIIVSDDFTEENDNEPLIYFNGVKFSTRQLSIVNQDTIKSITIQKGKTSAEMLGENEKNGVILVRSDNDVFSTNDKNYKEVVHKESKVDMNMVLKSIGGGNPYFIEKEEVKETTILNDPLVVINDKISTAADLQSLSHTEIESLTLIKDSIATKVYGDIAKNGVVLVRKK